MKVFYTCLLSIIAMLFLSSCKSTEEKEQTESEKPPVDVPVYPWEDERTELLKTKDLVLIYGGGAHRTTTWDEEHLAPYVTYKDESGKEQWLFDGFLFLEIHNGKGKEFAAGYTHVGANLGDWTNLVDYYFQPWEAVGALNRSINQAIKRIGEPKEKRKIVIGIPEPISGQKDWGSLENGVMLDFSKSADRLEACKWYVDYVREKFRQGNYKNLELAGFYWIAEEATNTRDIVKQVAAYLNEKQYSFNWIPYFKSDGYGEWKDLKFNYAFLQPNYFFNDNVPYSRLNDACKLATDKGMDMELEFDENALLVNGKGYKLMDYMKAFRENGIWETKRIAYYQGSAALYLLSVSKTPDDQKLYHEFCKFVAERP